MADILTVAAVADAPDLITFDLDWRDEAIRFRPLGSDDGPRLSEYFGTLSFETRYLYHPHPFTPEYAEQLCAENGRHETLRMVATRQQEIGEAVAAYFILDFDLSGDDVIRSQGYGAALERPILRIGPSVSDSIRGQGLGAVLMEVVVEIARRFWCAHIILLGGVFAINERAIRFYEKVGFRRMGTYGGGEGPASWDMMRVVLNAPHDGSARE